MIVSDFNRDEYRWYLRQIADSNPDRAGELISLLALRAAARSLPFAFTEELFDWVSDKDKKISVRSDGDDDLPVHRLIELLDIYEVLNGKSAKYVDVFSRNYYGVSRNLSREPSTAKFTPFLMSIYSCSYALAARAYSDDVNVCIGYTLAALSSSIVHPVLLEEALMDLREVSKEVDQIGLHLWRESSHSNKNEISFLIEFAKKELTHVGDSDIYRQLARSFISLNNLVPLPKDFLNWLDKEIFKGSLNLPHGASNVSNKESPAKVDKLNRALLAEVLAKNLTHSENSHHRTIGLLGDWGSGKSTVLNLLKNKIRNRRGEQSFVFGEFNAWAYEHSDNIQAGIAQEVLNAVVTVEAYDVPARQRDEKKLAYWKRSIGSRVLNAIWHPIRSFALRSWITLLYALRTQKLQLLKSVVVLFVALLPGMLASQKIDPDWFSWLGELSGENKTLLDNLIFQLVWFVGFGVYFLKEIRSLMANPLSKELLTYIRLPDYAKHLGDIPVMRENIKVMCNIRLGHLCGKPKRMLFVVDDLDRCSHESIVKVLEAIRLVLELENVIVLIAIDQNIALAALSDHFKDFSEHHKLKNSHAIAREYLSKIINLPIVLAEPSETDVISYLNDLWPKLPEDTKIIKNVNENSQKISRDSVAELSRKNESFGGDNVRSDIVTKVDNDKSALNKVERPPLVNALSGKHRASFIAWVTYFGLTNPRQLKRLNNSYDLMLGYLDYWDKEPVPFSFPKAKVEQAYPMLLTLILMEYLNSLEDLESRGRIWRKLFSDQSLVKFSPSENIAIVDAGVFDKQLVSTDFIKAYSEMLELQEYKGLPSKVEAFVLPAMT